MVCMLVDVCRARVCLSKGELKREISVRDAGFCSSRRLGRGICSGFGAEYLLRAYDHVHVIIGIGFEDERRELVGVTRYCHTHKFRG